MADRISLKWLVEEWNMWDDPYIKNIWLDTESLDTVRIMQDLDSSSDIEENYIDIESDIERFHCMPSRDSLDKYLVMERFARKLPAEQRDDLMETLSSFRPEESYRMKIFDFGLEDQFNEFKDKYQASILYEWAKNEKIKVQKDIDTLYL
ncbi:MAG: UPF0158 family protein [Tissierellia bacterium]|nr:UPF0158 family protein [Tissierellia bacterium]